MTKYSKHTTDTEAPVFKIGSETHVNLLDSFTEPQQPAVPVLLQLEGHQCKKLDDESVRGEL